jgi:hypothetical protein
MTSPAENEPALPAVRAFVVQLQGEAAIASGHWVGRIVHVVSGRSTHFATLPELVGFIEHVLAGNGASALPLPPNEP